MSEQNIERRKPFVIYAGNPPDWLYLLSDDFDGKRLQGKSKTKKQWEEHGFSVKKNVKPDEFVDGRDPFRDRPCKIAKYKFDKTERFTDEKWMLFRIYMLATSNVGGTYAVRRRDFGKERQLATIDSGYRFQWHQMKISFADCRAHWGTRKDSFSRHVEYKMGYTHHVTADIDYHPKKYFHKEHQYEDLVRYAYEFKTLYAALASRPPIFGEGIKYNVLWEPRKDRHGCHVQFIFPPDQPLEAEFAEERIRQLLHDIRINPDLEIYPSHQNLHHLILMPFAPTHALIAEKPYTDQIIKMQMVHDIWVDWEPFEPMPVEDVAEYLHWVGQRNDYMTSRGGYELRMMQIATGGCHALPKVDILKPSRTFLFGGLELGF